MAWTYLLIASLFEIGWPVGLKLAGNAGAFSMRAVWIAFSILCMAASGLFLLLSQREIAMGTAYAVWTGIGAVGAFAIGIAAFGDPASMMRFVSVGLIVAGVVGLKFA